MKLLIKVNVDDILVVSPSDSLDLKSDINIESLGVNLIYALKNLKFDLHQKKQGNSKYLDIKIL